MQGQQLVTLLRLGLGYLLGLAVELQVLAGQGAEMAIPTAPNLVILHLMIFPHLAANRKPKGRHKTQTLTIHTNLPQALMDSNTLRLITQLSSSNNIDKIC
jgi:hypothetical protein